MNLQDKIKKYTKICMKDLYNVDCLVFFRDMHDTHKAIFRDKSIPPWSIEDWEVWKKRPMCSITFHSRIFRIFRINDTIEEIDSPDIWKTMIHEVTHYLEGGYSYNTYRIYHSQKFRELEKVNSKKLSHIRKAFTKN